MKSFIVSFRFGLVALLLVAAFSATGVQAEDSGPKDHCNSAFSLHSALENAQDTDDPIIPRGLPGATQSKNVQADDAITGFAGLLQRIINGLTGIAAAVAVFFLVFNGGSMILAAGDTEKIKKARTGIMWALLGLLLIMGSYIIAKTVISLTYSGNNVQTEGSNHFHKDCIEEPASQPVTTPVVTEETNQCKPMPAIPPSCYSGDLGNQTGGLECDARIQDDGSLRDLCQSMFGRDECSIRDIQGQIPYDRLGDTFPQECRSKDGQYGQCTRQAIELYYDNEEFCPKEETSNAETSG